MKATRAIILMLLCPTLARAQSGYDAAEGNTSLISKDYSSVSVDFKETALAYQFVNATTTVYGGRWWNMKVTLAAEKGKRTLFAKGEFVPGAEINVRRAWVTNRTSGTQGGYTAWYANAGADVVRWKRVEFDNLSAVALKENVGEGCFVGVGVNVAPRENGFIFGGNAQMRWRRDAPQAQKPTSTWIQATEGLTTGGKSIAVGETEDRYVGGTVDDRAFLARFDLMTPRSLFGPGDPKAFGTDRPSAAVLGAISAQAREGHATVFNLAAGPALFVPGEANKMVGALLLEWSDVTHSAVKGKTHFDQISARLYVGYPFK